MDDKKIALSTISLSKLSVKTRSKGYAAAKSNIQNKFDGYIFERLSKFTNIKIKSLSRTNDKKIINKILGTNSQNGASKDKQTDESFIPKGFEENEAKHFNDSDFLRYLAYRYRYNIYPITKVLEDYPPCVQIEPTSVCNFRCVMCYQVDKTFSNKSSGHMGYMDLDVYKKAIDELEGNIEAITLASRGEPLLHPKIKEMISYTGNKFLGFKLNTNASLLNEDMCHTLLQSGLNTLVFSVDAADKEMYETIRVNGKFEKTFANIKRFSEIKKNHYSKSKMNVKVSGVKISASGQDIDSLIDFWGKYVDDVAFVNYNPWESAYDNKQNEIEKPCTDLWRRMFLWQDGSVNPCDYDYKSTLFKGYPANINDLSLKEIWNSKFYTSLREAHLQRRRSEIEPCRRCPAI